MEDAGELPGDAGHVLGQVTVAGGEVLGHVVVPDSQLVGEVAHQGAQLLPDCLCTAQQQGRIEQAAAGILHL